MNTTYQQQIAMSAITDAAFFFGGITPNTAGNSDYWSARAGEAASIVGWPVITKTEIRETRKGDKVIQHLRFWCGETTMVCTSRALAERAAAWLNERWDGIYKNLAQSFCNAPVTRQDAPQAPQITLEDLVHQYGAENVLQANGGAIPGTLEELEHVFEVLSHDRAS